MYSVRGKKEKGKMQTHGNSFSGDFGDATNDDGNRSQPQTPNLVDY
jgi:hypothetical protein